MFETFRMLGQEHEADLAREANRRRLAALLPKRRREPRHLEAERQSLPAPTLPIDHPRTSAAACRPR